MQSSKKGGNKFSLALIALLYRLAEEGNGFGAQEIPKDDTNRDDGCKNSPNTG